MACRDRIANQVFDDPPRVLPPEPEKAKVALEMDDKKSHKVSLVHFKFMQAFRSSSITLLSPLCHDYDKPDDHLLYCLL